MLEYQKEELDQTNRIVKELNQFSYQWEAVALFKDEPWRKRIVLKDGIVAVNFSRYDRKYDFYLRDKLPYVSNYTYDKIKEGIKAPQQVGVLTEKKIADWINFLTAVQSEAKKISEERVKDINKFLAKMAEMGAEVRKEYNDGYSGELVKNGLEFRFEVGNDDGYISKRITLYYQTGNTEDVFLKLADNQYKG